MASFSGLAQDIASVAKMLSDSCDKGDAAMFLISQQDIIQNQVIEARVSGANKANNSKNSAQAGGAAAKKGMDSVYANLMKTAKNSK